VDRKENTEHCNRSQNGSEKEEGGVSRFHILTCLLQELFDTALEIKRRIYGNRIVLFAPLYLSNYCINSCTYCGYRLPNKDAKRKIITQSELEAEVAALQHQGHRRVLLLTGEHPKYPFSKFIKALETVRDIKTEPHGSIRRINVEIPPLSISDFRKLCATDCVGTYTVFQESYHQETYKRTHPAGPKADYEWRLTCMDRANLGGIDDVGLGALFGLYDYRFEVMGLLMHAEHLDNTYGAGPHTISIPRMQPAQNAPDSHDIPALVTDDQVCV
jgi:thiazole biosynthesis protein ThiH